MARGHAATLATVAPALATVVAAGAAVALARRLAWYAAARNCRAPPPPPLVVVIGLGGVGSHAAHLLVRGGVRRLRLVDFDYVSLSSLNRHATAVRADVGTPKAAALRAALLRVVPEASIEAHAELFCGASAARLLEAADLVIDCIDDIATKEELLSYCFRKRVRVLSALGAGGKADACALHLGRLSEVLDDPIARSMLKKIRRRRRAVAKAQAAADDDAAMLAAADVLPAGGGVTGDGVWWEEVEDCVTVVYSSERQKVSLLPLPDGVGSAAELGAQPNFRVRVMPVMPPLPAAVGAALAAHALSVLDGRPPRPPARPMPSLTPQYQIKLYHAFLKREAATFSAQSAAPPTAAPTTAPATTSAPMPAPHHPPAALTYRDVGIIVCDVFRCRCAISGVRLGDPKRPHFVLCRYDANLPATPRNILFVQAEVAAKHAQEGIGALSGVLRRRIEACYEMGLCGRSISFFDEACRPAAADVQFPVDMAAPTPDTRACVSHGQHHEHGSRGSGPSRGRGAERPAVESQLELRPVRGAPARPPSPMVPTASPAPRTPLFAAETDEEEVDFE